MAGMVMTSIYITPAQKRALARRAKEHRTTVSEEIRSALDRHLHENPTLSLATVGLLPRGADKTVHRMVRKLDETHVLLATIRKTLRKKKLQAEPASFRSLRA